MSPNQCLIELNMMKQFKYLNMFLVLINQLYIHFVLLTFFGYGMLSDSLLLNFMSESWTINI